MAYSSFWLLWDLRRSRKNGKDYKRLEWLPHSLFCFGDSFMGEDMEKVTNHAFYLYAAYYMLIIPLLSF